MKNISILLLIILSVCGNTIAQQLPKHFIFFARERDRIHEKNFLRNKHIAGAQLKYTWRELEPVKDRYNLDLIQKDLDFLNSKGKKLFIQLQDVSFDTMYKCVPNYIIQDKEYHGGHAIQYDGSDSDRVMRRGGFIARRWDTAMAARFFKLLAVLGERFDGKIEGINLPETSADFGETGRYFPPGFTHEIYKNAIKEYMLAAKKAFPKSVFIQYANFMPGEWLPWKDKSYLRELYALAKEKGIGMGGPDLKVHNKGHRNNGYRFIKEYSPCIITGLAVQDGNYAEVDPNTGKRVTVEEMFDFAKNVMGLDYIFWCTEEPYYTKEVLPFLRSAAGAR